MDWLDEYLENLFKKQHGLQSTLIAYLMFTTLCVLFAHVLTLTVINSWSLLLLGGSERLTFWELLTWRLPQEVLGTRIKGLLLIETVRRFSLFFYTLIGIIVVSILFFRRKIFQPLMLLNHEIERIKSGELKEPVFFNNNNEFDGIFQNFEAMRRSLGRSQQQIRQLHEEQRRVNATFSHDLRTPLTIMLSNVEMIEDFYFKGMMTEEMLENSLKKIKNNLYRLTDFADTMKEIGRIDEIQVIRKYQPLALFLENVNDLCDGLDFQNIVLKTDGDFNRQAEYDLQILMEISENILTNAMRFAKSEIEITVQVQQNYLYLFVKDDGIGFSQEGLARAASPYYSTDKGEHFGLGLTICTVLVGKHGGVLKLANGLHGGAVVSAVFSI